jgi:hypothetical protein
LIEVPEGASFEDMIALKGKSDIGEQINKRILRPLFAANGLEGSIELVDFDDDDKLGSGKEKSYEKQSKSLTQKVDELCKTQYLLKDLKTELAHLIYFKTGEK